MYLNGEFSGKKFRIVSPTGPFSISFAGRNGTGRLQYPTVASVFLEFAPSSSSQSLSLAGSLDRITRVALQMIPVAFVQRLAEEATFHILMHSARPHRTTYILSRRCNSFIIIKLVIRACRIIQEYFTAGARHGAN